MEAFRDNLISKIDRIISELNEAPDSRPDVQLQIEATILARDHPRGRKAHDSRKFVLGTVDVGNWKSADVLPTLPVGDAELRRVPSGIAPNQDAAFVAVNPPSAVNPQGTGAAADESPPRRKTVGCLRIGATGITPPRTPSPPGTRQLASDQRNFPKRRKLEEGTAKLQPSTVDKLIEGIWEQIHHSNVLVVPEDISHAFEPGESASLDFADITRRCLLLTGVSRTTRSIEVMMQAHWIDCYYQRIGNLRDQRPDLRPQEHKKLAMSEACSRFEWSEKDLRNRMAIWKGYREIKDAAGWAALTFAGPGIYRFCKYRMGFDQDAISKLQSLNSRFEVAADTIQPHWRQTLSLVGVSNQRVYRGHPHDWVVAKHKDPVPLAWTYRQWDPTFSFTHIEASIIDPEAFPASDPRRVATGPNFTCTLCHQPQSSTAEQNSCECFSDLFGPNPQSSSPVQVFSTDDGRNNGLLACCAFDRGAPVGEFVGIVTKDLEDVDVMQCKDAAPDAVTYQIWQGRRGNFTKFINHSCVPNAQFQSFVWLGVQRTIVVSKGIAAGQEVTVDYSDRYWDRLKKTCLCRQAACRFKDR